MYFNSLLFLLLFPLFLRFLPRLSGIVILAASDLVLRLFLLAARPGHAANVAFAKKIKRMMEKYEHARENMVAQFASKTARPCSHSGRSYPDKPADLKNRLDEIQKENSMYLFLNSTVYSACHI